MRFLRRRRWLQISTRTLLLATFGICVWMGIWADRARRQERTVRQLANLNSSIGYRHEYNAAGKLNSNPIPPGPAWLRKLVGNHAFFEPYRVASGNLSDEDLGLVGQLSTLEELQVSGPISDVGLAKLAGLSKLKKINVQGPGITDQGFTHLAVMRDLEELRVGGATVTDEGLKHLASLSKLKKIVFDTTQITGKGNAWLKQKFPNAEVYVACPSQESEQDIVQQLIHCGARFTGDRDGWTAIVLLEGHRMTDEALAIVGQLEHLVQIELRNTLISVDAVKRLRESHPNVEIQPPVFDNTTENEESLAVLRRINANIYFSANGYVLNVTAFDEQLADDDLRLIAKLSHLERLVVASSTHITSAGIKYLRNCASLKSLLIERSPLSNDDLEELKGCDNLEFIGAHGLAITDAGLVHLAELKRLKELSFRDTGIAGPGLKQLSSLANLSRLSLSGDKSAIDDEGLLYLAALPQLRQLMLANTQITDAGLRHLNALPNLEALYLNNKHVTDAGLVQLQNLKKLKKLAIAGTGVSDEGVQALQQALPECKITR